MVLNQMRESKLMRGSWTRNDCFTLSASFTGTDCTGGVQCGHRSLAVHGGVCLLAGRQL